ncbi:MAG: molybdopterin-synthase adenylyltransferase MoeB [Nitrososphaerota archaeon]|jgi:adenylyltransferase/sulfurtransferase|nr:molybdopterin-synthase adenylyltransferase MoeB [Nitrososphaerota archaeon]
MKVRISIPGTIRQRVGGKGEFVTDAGTVKEAMSALVSQYPDLRDYLFSGEERLRNFINMYVNGDDIRTMGGLDTKLKDGDTIIIVPSVAGGGPESELTLNEIMRYDRHLIMPEVGVNGQKKLKAASVLVVGVGGLGTPAATYLAAAGVGRIGLVDFDRIEFSNLHRQVLYSEEDVGKSKVEVARTRLMAVNPNVVIETYPVRLDSSNALDIIRNYDVILDGTDNFPTRYLVNDASVLVGKPVVHSSIYRFEGQASVFMPGRGPCYRCLYPEPPPPGLVPSCAEGGVFGVLPSVMGSIQAVESLKLILGVGEPLIGRLLIFDALEMQFRELKVKKDPSCPICGSNPSIKALIDYEEFCGLNRNINSDEEIESDLLQSWLKEGKRVEILDVREPYENQIWQIPGAKHIPLSQLRNRLNELDPNVPVVAYCQVGSRSLAAVRLLKEKGFGTAKSLRGGIDAWAVKADQSVRGH